MPLVMLVLVAGTKPWFDRSWIAAGQLTITQPRFRNYNRVGLAAEVAVVERGESGQNSGTTLITTQSRQVADACADNCSVLVISLLALSSRSTNCPRAIIIPVLKALIALLAAFGRRGRFSAGLAVLFAFNRFVTQAGLSLLRPAVWARRSFVRHRSRVRSQRPVQPPRSPTVLYLPSATELPLSIQKVPPPRVVGDRFEYWADDLLGQFVAIAGRAEQADQRFAVAYLASCGRCCQRTSGTDSVAHNSRNRRRGLFGRHDQLGTGRYVLQAILDSGSEGQALKPAVFRFTKTDRRTPPTLFPQTGCPWVGAPVALGRCRLAGPLWSAVATLARLPT